MSTVRCDGAGGRVLPGLLLVLPALGILAGCEDGTPPTGPTNPFVEGQVIRLENHSNWSTNSVSWKNEAQNGVVPNDAYGLIATSLEANPNDSGDFFFKANVVTTCDGCFPGTSPVGDSNIALAFLDWSPSGASITFQARRLSGFPAGERVFVMGANDSEVQGTEWGGRMPSFSHDGSTIVYVNDGQTAVVRRSSAGGPEGVIRDGLQSVSCPRFSPDDALIAFSSFGTDGQRIRFINPDEPGLIPVAVSDPDAAPEQTRDGRDDLFPTWSPGGAYIAYKSTATLGNQITDGIFVAERRSPTPENPTPRMVRKVMTLEPGEQLRHLRWHPSGERLLFIVGGDVFMLIMPEDLRDVAP